MKFLIEQEEMKRALQDLNHCISKSNDIADITLGVLLELYDKRLVLKGTNLTTYIEKIINVTESYEGTILVKFDLLKGLVDKFPPGIIEFELKGNEMELRQQKIRYRVPTYSNVDEFPKKPQIIEGPSFEIPQNLLMEIIKKTVKGLKGAENTPYLCGMYINILKTKQLILYPQIPLGCLYIIMYQKKYFIIEKKELSCHMKH